MCQNDHCNGQRPLLMPSPFSIVAVKLLYCSCKTFPYLLKILNSIRNPRAFICIRYLMFILSVLYFESRFHFCPILSPLLDFLYLFLNYLLLWGNVDWYLMRWWKCPVSAPFIGTSSCWTFEMWLLWQDKFLMLIPV